MMWAFVLGCAGTAHAAAGLLARVSPVEKVVTMMEELQYKVTAEGAAEAATYNEFACFCKAQTKAKREAITEAEAHIAKLSGLIAVDTTERQRLTDDSYTLRDEISTITGEIQNNTDDRTDNHDHFVAVNEQLTANEAAIYSAAQNLKAQTHRPTLLEEAADSEADSEEADSDEAPDLSVPNADYESKSNGIIETLEGLHTTFRDKKSDLTRKEAADKGQFERSIQRKKALLQQKETTAADNDDLVGTTSASLAEMQAELTSTTATCNDDKLYLAELSRVCEEKSVEWDQRTTLRQKELVAIGTAISTLDGLPSDRTNTTELLQVHETRAVVEVAGPVLAQLKLVRAAPAADWAPDATVVQVSRLFSDVAAHLAAPQLSALATTIVTDQFANVRGLIQDLITKLKKEQADDATKEGWCRDETAKNSKERDYRLGELDRLETLNRELHARDDALEEEKATLLSDIASLNKALRKAGNMRNAEQTENNQTMDDAELGENVTMTAYGVLQDFYSAAAQETTNKSAQDNETAARNYSRGEQPDLGAPDAGTKGGAYKGDQSASTGILGMLEVIAKDFKRQHREAGAQEAQQTRDFVAYERETDLSVSTKSSALADCRINLGRTKDDAATSLSDATSMQGLLDASTRTLVDLQAECEPSGQGARSTGMTAEERKARREAEIDALKQALCTLDEQYGSECQHGS